MSVKTCTRCKTEKPLEAFAICRAARSGLQFHCRACQSESRYHDTTSGRARLWKERTRTCTSCEKRLWTDAEDGHFNDDPRGKVCDICVRKPIIIEARRQRKVEAGHKAWANYTGATYVPPAAPPPAPPKPRRRAPQKPPPKPMAATYDTMTPASYVDMMLAEQKAREASAARRAARLLRASIK